ncbi:hypothetical protein CRG98_044838, partial [Punica granatum]
MISGLALQQSRLMQHLQVGESKSASHQPSRSAVGHYSLTARIGKLEFPRFCGDGVREWLYRCEQFFEVDETPDNVKLKLVVIHLEGRALQWHQSYVRSLGVEGKSMGWNEYVAAVVSRFGDTGYEDSMTDLKNLKQLGAVQDYMDEFDALLNKVSITESDALSHFLGGLRTEIQLPIRMFHPTTLAQAYSLAKLQESTYLALHKPDSPVPKLQNIFSSNNYIPSQNTLSNTSKSIPHTHHKPVPATNNKGNGLLPLPSPVLPRNLPFPHSRPHKTLTQKELEEKRAKNLCFWCDEKFVPRHKCSRRQAFLIEVEAEEEEPKVEVEGEQEETCPLISLHALLGTRNFQTMSVVGTTGKRLLHILVDSGSTHNFLNVETGKKLGCQTELVPAVKVAVANGNELRCEKMCKKFKWRMQ